ncbi:MAG: tetratricopeptide repeat protein [Oscillospiraceae bacterium]|nr:tetratricopeptide repeat protein [Oscillospiraceae bacterium]
MKDLIVINKRSLGKEHMNTAMVYNNIGVVYYNKRGYSEALDYFRKAFMILKNQFGENHHHTQAVKEWIAKTEKQLK